MSIGSFRSNKIIDLGARLHPGSWLGDLDAHQPRAKRSQYICRHLNAAPDGYFDANSNRYGYSG